MRAISKVTINALCSYVSMGLSLVINIFLIPYVIRTLGKEVFGIVALIQSLQFVIGMAGSGLNQAFGRMYAMHYAADNRDELVGYYASAIFIIQFIVVPVTLLLTFLLMVYALPLFQIPVELLFQARLLLITLGFFSVLNFLAIPYTSVCTATQKFHIISFCEIIFLIIWAFCVVLFLRRWPTLFSYGLSYVAARCVHIVLIMFFSRRVLPYCRFAFRHVMKKKITSIFSLSTQVMSTNLSDATYTHANQMIINSYMGSLQNTYFAVCLVWLRMLARILDAVGSVMAPQITMYQANEQWFQVKEGLIRSTKYSFIIGISLGGVLAILPKEIFEVWLGSGYEVASETMFWIALSLPWVAAQLPVTAILIALGRYKIPSILSPVFAIINVITVLAGVMYFRFDLVAVAVVYFGCNFMRLGILQPIYAAYQCRASMSEYVMKSYFKGVLSFLPAGACLIGFRQWIDIWSFYRLALVLCVTGVIYLLSVWFLALDNWDRNLVLSYLQKIKVFRFKRQGVSS